MFCYQCEQTAKGEGCTKLGVCGKEPEVAALQDLLIYALKGLSVVAVEARKVGITDRDVNVFTCEATFSTLTNVDFDAERFSPMLEKCVKLREGLKEKIKAKGGRSQFSEEAANFVPAKTIEDMVKQGEKVGIKQDPESNPDIHALKWTLVIGLKGVAAYADHAQILGKEDDSVYAFVQEGLASTLRTDLGLNDWVGLVLKCGEANLKAMEILDAANTEAYGHPVPTKVPLGAKKGKAILVSGHDLKDLEMILKQTEGKGIYVYTHGEMLPCHGYPGLKKYDHLYGHYGTAWQNQAKEFAEFPGAILMTTNCIQRPRDSYKDNIFTTGLVGWPGVRHIADKDFSPVIEKALSLPGFQADANGRSVMVGFARNAVMGVAGKMIEAVKAGAIKHFFLVAGCDGAKPGRNYYTEFVEKVPKDSVVLTLACGKFRFFDKDLGDIGGIPRLLDIGQCNDAYSAIQIALALSKAFGVGVNDLPLSMILSWYEQKAVAILLTLFYLGIKNIRLGPSLPAFITPNVLKVLVDNFNIMPISTPDADLKAILG
ncbi:MAG: hydroxylamine reductase [Deltaproteobacteria bacterium CG_4_8_14_3_um_filter_51_11]|nr:hydroxylamine reductase [bacterium]OIP43793.1 MAG: hydroxylamine reductase [Desulfobacteraceae bacterium CG2_30_51_40]PIX19692.1 MAG: hydroxylamine reductase [Deltaproteobacteria bacterium CG_4_8_14_3_um_filter_51_11]PIY23876.1 MAG: hydroxylamine reductase [Deltaproteobacteria bacterium CG_4_10_14_3_um_filter_51_14]PJB37644.1 MAG: hydroxylamine reductase [Deltaproteobacteria bacterium CG_4_9_14_3_um_filter_51_14]